MIFSIKHIINRECHLYFIQSFNVLKSSLTMKAAIQKIQDNNILIFSIYTLQMSHQSVNQKINVDIILHRGCCTIWDLITNFGY